MTKQRPFQEWLMQQCGDETSWRQHSLDAGLSDIAISRYMRGSYPNLESMEKLALHFGVPRAHIESLVRSSKLLDTLERTQPAVVDDFDLVLRQLVSQMSPDQKRKLVNLAQLVIADKL